MTEDAQQPPKQSVLAMIFGGIGALIGVVVGRYAGFALVIPAAFGLMVGWILSMTVPATSKPVVPASAIQAGHGLWMLLGMVLLSMFGLNLIECAAMIGGAIWLAYSPSVIIVALLICYQAVGIVINGMAFAEATRNTDIHKALMVHLFLRLAAVVTMLYGLIESRNLIYAKSQPVELDMDGNEPM